MLEHRENDEAVIESHCRGPAASKTMRDMRLPRHFYHRRSSAALLYAEQDAHCRMLRAI